MTQTKQENIIDKFESQFPLLVGYKKNGQEILDFDYHAEERDGIIKFIEHELRLSSLDTAGLILQKVRSMKIENHGLKDCVGGKCDQFTRYESAFNSALDQISEYILLEFKLKQDE